MTTQEVATLEYEPAPPFGAPTVETDKVRALHDVEKILVGMSALTSTHNKFSIYYSRLEQLASDRTLWVDQEIVPTPVSRAIAELVLQRLEEMHYLPGKIVATADNGIAICFIDGSKYADIESTATGGILCVLSDGVNRPTVWEDQPSEGSITQAVSRVREFIGSSSSHQDDTRTTWDGSFLSASPSFI